jgi:predicted small lipoprotein YifL
MSEGSCAAEPVYCSLVTGHRSIMRIAVSSLAVVIALAGCGYKGPLYIPKPKPVAQKPAQPATTSAAPAEPAAPVPPPAQEMTTTPGTPGTPAEPPSPATR